MRNNVSLSPSDKLTLGGGGEEGRMVRAHADGTVFFPLGGSGQDPIMCVGGETC